MEYRVPALLFHGDRRLGQRKGLRNENQGLKLDLNLPNRSMTTVSRMGTMSKVCQSINSTMTVVRVRVVSIFPPEKLKFFILI